MAQINFHRTLLLFPCCAAKEQIPTFEFFEASPPLRKQLSTTRNLLRTTQKIVKKNFREAFPKSDKWPALFLYNGHQYRVSGFRKRVWEAISQKGMHCCILSGGFGLVDACEPIPSYNLSMQKSAKYWRTVLPKVLREYIRKHKIKRVYVAGSASYLTVLKDPSWRGSAKVYKYAPVLAKGEGGALTKVPRLVGKAVVQLLKHEVAVGLWERW